MEVMVSKDRAVAVPSPRAVLLLVAALGVSLVSGVPGARAERTDKGFIARQLFNPPARAGLSVTDPAFGSRILRVTDASISRGGCGTAYSYWPTFNQDVTKILVQCAEGWKLFHFDKQGFTSR